MLPRVIVLNSNPIGYSYLFRIFDTEKNEHYWISNNEVGYIKDSKLREFVFYLIKYIN